MPRTLGRRFWLEGGLSLVTGLLALATLAWPDWVELVLGAEPDARDGSSERLLFLTLAAVTVALLAASRVEWRRAVRREAVAD